MKIIHSISEMQSTIIALKKAGKTVGVVPTMGALHEGHLHLLDEAKRKADITVVTVFVNPIQFGEKKDLELYPQTLDIDSELAENRGADYLFAPSATAMYPKNYDTTVSCGGVTTRLEGAARVGHFDGVTTVVAKLFNITLPNFALFGQKDAQQAVVISKMVLELNFAIELIIYPTVREEDGLAMSSRNQLLTPIERADVGIIYAGLREAKELFDSGERAVDVIRKAVISRYSSTSLFKNEYISITNLECEIIDGDIGLGALLSIACRTSESGTRLIDNTILGELV